MANTYFAFKQFTIYQDKTAMKVGTDGVLLGAWVNASQSKRVLDIGTGTGLIALMIAQKSTAKIDAVEIEKKSYQQAKSNIEKSKWADRIAIFHCSFQTYADEITGEYDLIVSNPPYFQNSLKNPSIERTLSRHNDELSFDDLLTGVQKRLSSNGRFCLILPLTEGKIFINKAKNCNLFCNKMTEVLPKKEKKAKRILMEFSRAETNCKKDTLVIEKDIRHDYTSAYIDLTKEFYIHF